MLSSTAGTVTSQALPQPALENPEIPSDSLRIPSTDPNSNHDNSDLSSAPQSPTHQPSSDVDSPSSANESNDTDFEVEGQDEDAEGSPDDEAPIRTGGIEIEHSAATSSSSSDESGARKRKRSIDEEDYIEANPALYGIRRSGRVKITKRTKTVESDSDDSDIDVRPATARRKAKSAKASKKNTPSYQSPAPQESEEEEDVYGSKRDKAERRRRKRLLQQHRDSPAAPAERVSSRGVAKQVNYNEDEHDLNEDDLLEDGYDANAVQYYYDDRPGVHEVLDYRRKQENDDSKPALAKYQYSIWWQDSAPYHATWEDWEDLKDRTGNKKVQNYMKNKIVPYWQIMRDDSFTLEDKEQLNIDNVREADTRAAQKQIQRVVSERKTETGVQYYVKWNTLDYQNCTWEDHDLVQEIAEYELQRYLNRRDLPPIVSKTTRHYDRMGLNGLLQEQPAFLKNGTLRDFQLKGLSRIAIAWSKGINSILGDEMGLGKTVQTVAFIGWLKHHCGIHGPSLVVVPKGVIKAWQDTMDNWTPDLNWVTYTGSVASRRIIEEKELFEDPSNPTRLKVNVVLTTYEMFRGGLECLKRIKWQFLAVDEAHRLKNEENKLYLELQRCDVASRLLITGTPFQNDHQELVALLGFLQPEQDLKAQYDFKTQDEDRQAAQIEDLRSKLRTHLIRRTKEEVASDLPQKKEKIIRVELSDMQLDYYKNILTRNYAALAQASNGAKIGLSNIMIELKKASIHPYLFHGVEEHYLQGETSPAEILRGLIKNSGKMMLLDQLLTKLKQDGHRVLIFSGFVMMLDVLSQYLQRRDHKFQRLDGQTAGTARDMAMHHFNAQDSDDFAFLLSTRAGGLGINLYTADTVILFDSDWNPQADLQAMARAHRIGQKKPVTVYRFVSRDTVEEEILERARNKLFLEYVTIERGYSKAESRDLQQKMADKGASSEEAKGAEDISRILRKRGQKMFDQESNQKKLEDLDIDAVLNSAEEHQTSQPQGVGGMNDEEFLRNFTYTDVDIKMDWDQIIPKADRDRVADEEERKRREEQQRRDEEYVRSLTMPRKTKMREANERNHRAAKDKAKDKSQAKAAAGSDDELEDDSETSEAEVVDPKKPLTEKEARDLVQAFQAFGSMDDRPEDVVRLANLQNRDFDMVKATLQEFLDIAQAKIDEHDQSQKSKGDTSEKTGSKKNQKAIMFEHRGQQRLNAETILRRPYELRMLKKVVDAVGEAKKFTIDDAIKGNDFDVEWGPREDGMLAIGVIRHGFGKWREIEEDEELNMKGKFFLNEAHVEEQKKREKEGGKPKKPAGPHLIRRINYLMDVIVDRLTKGEDEQAHEAVVNHHRNNKRDIPDDPATRQRQKRRERDFKRKQREQTQRDHDRDHLGAGHSSASPSAERTRVRPSEKPHMNGVELSPMRGSHGSASPAQRHKDDHKSFKHRLSNGERPRSPLVTGKDGLERGEGVNGHSAKHVRPHREHTPTHLADKASKHGRDVSQSRKRKSDSLDGGQDIRERPDKARVSAHGNHAIYSDKHGSQAVRSDAKAASNSSFSVKQGDMDVKELLKPVLGVYEKIKQEYKTLKTSSDPETRKLAAEPIKSWIREVMTLINNHKMADDSQFEQRVWDYVAEHVWFTGGVSGEALAGMGKRVKKQDEEKRKREEEKKKKEKIENSQTTKAANGESNGGLKVEVGNAT